MPRYRPNPQDNPEKPGGEGWLVNDQQQLVCQFKPDARTSQAQWVSVRTYSWIPPRQPAPQTQRRMLRHKPLRLVEDRVAANRNASALTKRSSCRIWRSAYERMRISDAGIGISMTKYASIFEVIFAVDGLLYSVIPGL